MASVFFHGRVESKLLVTMFKCCDQVFEHKYTTDIQNDPTRYLYFRIAQVASYRSYEMFDQDTKYRLADSYVLHCVALNQDGTFAIECLVPITRIDIHNADPISPNWWALPYTQFKEILHSITSSPASSLDSHLIRLQAQDNGAYILNFNNLDYVIDLGGKHRLTMKFLTDVPNVSTQKVEMYHTVALGFQDLDTAFRIFPPSYKHKGVIYYTYAKPILRMTWNNNDGLEISIYIAGYSDV